MTTALDVLAANGIIDPPTVADAAAQAGLELAAACALLDMESDGGLNVWGHDPVDTGGIYAKGALVTEGAYLAYKAKRAQLGAQGVGPCQLTYPPLQDQADAAGGCWVPAVNMRVGFAQLAALVQTHGELAGFAAYNGSGPAAQDYGARAVGLLATWRARLAGLPTGASTATEADLPLTDADAQKVAQAVLAALIPDYYARAHGNPTAQLPAGVALGWDAAHVGNLLDDIAAIKRKLGIT